MSPFYTEKEVQKAIADYLRAQRKKSNLSRDALSLRSTVPPSTIKRFELTGEISLRQLLLLWQSLDDLNRIYELTEDKSSEVPSYQSIDEVLGK